MHVADAIRKVWPHGWTQAGYHERLDAPEGAGSGWLSGRGVSGFGGLGARVRSSLARRGTGPAGPSRWSGQAHNERLDATRRRRR